METSVVWLKNAFECLMSGDFPTTSDIRFVIKIQVFLSLSKKKTHMACFQIVFTLVPIYFVVGLYVSPLLMSENLFKTLELGVFEYMNLKNFACGAITPTVQDCKEDSNQNH